jgi:3'(2'), 5'-bisphosphate nucleotidase
LTMIPGVSKERLISVAITTAKSAGDAILDVYGSDFAVEHKNDRSPLTLADRRSHEVISGFLSNFSCPIVSEEGKDVPYSKRKEWSTFWLVDPLDGTKEFIKRNGEFTVNIALVCGGCPVLGVIYVPVQGSMYFAAEGMGSWKCADASFLVAAMPEEKRDAEALFSSILSRSVKLPIDQGERPFTVVGSRSHQSGEFGEFLAGLESGRAKAEMISSGSSLKFCLVAEGRADLYPRLGPTMEWDTAAG